MDGFTEITDFTQPHFLTTKDRLVMTVAPQGLPPQEMTFKVLFIRKEVALLGPANPDAKVKLLKLDFPVKVDADLASTCKVFRESGYVPRSSPEEVPAAPKRGARAAEGETKISKCKALFAAHPEWTREQMEKAFIDDVHCTKAGATTYYLTCKKEAGAK